MLEQQTHLRVEQVFELQRMSVWCSPARWLLVASSTHTPTLYSITTGQLWHYVGRSGLLHWVAPSTVHTSCSGSTEAPSGRRRRGQRHYTGNVQVVHALLKNLPLHVEFSLQ